MFVSAGHRSSTELLQDLHRKLGQVRARNTHQKRIWCPFRLPSSVVCQDRLKTSKQEETLYQRERFVSLLRSLPLKDLAEAVRMVGTMTTHLRRRRRTRRRNYRMILTGEGEGSRSPHHQQELGV